MVQFVDQNATDDAVHMAEEEQDASTAGIRVLRTVGNWTRDERLLAVVLQVDRLVVMCKLD